MNDGWAAPQHDAPPRSERESTVDASTRRAEREPTVDASTRRAERASEGVSLLADPATIAGGEDARATSTAPSDSAPVVTEQARSEAGPAAAREDPPEASPAAAAAKAAPNGGGTRAIATSRAAEVPGATPDADVVTAEGADVTTPEAAATPDDLESAGELDALRSALQLQSDELDALRGKWARTSIGTTTTREIPSSSTQDPVTTALLDAASARRLAADARERERASREALEATRRALGTNPSDGDARQNAPQRAETGEPESATETDAATETEATPAVDGPRTLVAERDELQAMLSMARKTLGHQREEIAALRARLEAAVTSTAAAEAPPEAPNAPPEAPNAPEDPDPSQAQHATPEDPDPSQAQHATPDQTTAPARPERPLPEAVPSGEARPVTESSRRSDDIVVAALEKLAARDERIDALLAEKSALAVTLEERTALLASRRAELDAIRDRLEAQDRALDSARREYDQERGRHTRTLETLARLRATLSESLPEELEADRPAATLEAAPPPNGGGPEARERAYAGADAASHAAPAIQLAGDAAPSAADAHPIPQPMTTVSDACDGWTTRPVVRLDADAPGLGVERPAPARIGDGLPTVEAPPDGDLRETDAQNAASCVTPIHTHWLDERVRWRFGPMGAECVADLLRDAQGVHGDPLLTRVLVLGRDGTTTSRWIADAMLASGATAFEIHCASSGRATPLPTESPLVSLIHERDRVDAPEQLHDLLDRVRPDAVLCHDFLSHMTDPEPWLDRLIPLRDDGATLLFAERIGRPIEPVHADLVEIGERIWSRMPTRYTRARAGEAPIRGWQDAFDASATRPANGLLDALRERAPLALVDRFGCLAAGFVDSPVAANFEASAPRDRRFVAQVADLDERRIEAGEAQPLHFVARVDPVSAD